MRRGNEVFPHAAALRALGRVVGHDADPSATVKVHVPRRLIYGAGNLEDERARGEIVPLRPDVRGAVSELQGEGRDGTAPAPSSHDGETAARRAR